MLKVRFLSSAPIFIFIAFMFFFCPSVDAVSLSEDTVYSFSDFNFYWTSASSASYISSSTPYYSGANTPTSTTNWQTAMIFASGAQSGNHSGSGASSTYPVSYFDIPVPNYRFVRFGFSIPLTALGSSSYNYSSSFVMHIGTSGSNYSTAFVVSPSWQNNAPVISATSSGSATLYYTDTGVNNGIAYFTLYYALQQNSYLLGFVKNQSRPTGVSGAWSLDLADFVFEVSSSKFIPPIAGGGSVDLSPVISDIASLSQQMSAGFLAVNNNIDAMETSISTSIDNQTAALEQSISDAADSVNDNFNDWDSSLSDAYTSSDNQIITDTNQAVSDLHDFEDGVLSDAESAIGDVGLDSYELPSDYQTAVGKIGEVFTVLFNSLDFITPLIIFSCTLGIASVIVGRKPRGGDG